MHIVLIPGLWLDGDSWERVVPIIEAEGHTAHPVTLPGMESVDADRSGVSVADIVASVVDVVDAVPEAAGQVLVVAHSAAGAIAHAVADTRPDRIARTMYVGGFPAGDGEIIAAGFATEGDGIPLPPFDVFDDADLVGLDAEGLASFRDRAVPSPISLSAEPLRLNDARRLDVPATLVCPEYTSEALVSWMESDPEALSELAALRHVEFVDLPTGHWPQFSAPEELGNLIVERAWDPFIDEHGRVHPPINASESQTALGFLDYQRATLAWKARDLDADGLSAKTGVSTLTLGGLLKHMAFVEHVWFSRTLHEHDLSSPWADVDWKANRDWDFESASDDDPATLTRLWQSSVLRSKAHVAKALTEGGLDRPASRASPEGDRVSLRWIVHHMIEEYARHNGHADFLREAVDGETGE